jgi:apolipoprotein N-acyltransferase
MTALGDRPAPERTPPPAGRRSAVLPAVVPVVAVRRGVLAAPVAVAAGAALLLSFPPYGLWWLAPPGVALLALVVHGRRLLAGAALGLLCGLTLFVPLLSWTGLHVGPVSLLLAASQAVLLALVGLAGSAVAPVLHRWGWAWPPVTGLLWVAQEAVRDRVPFGGFPWGRLAFSQEDSPLLRFASVGGAPLVTFAVAAAGGAVALAVVGALRPGARAGRGATRAGRWRVSAAALLGAVLMTVAGVAVPLGSPGGAAVTVAVVQGNVPRLGLDFNAQRRAVLDNHVRATLALADRVRAGTEPAPDLVVWPENASDIDPLIPADADAYREIGAAARAVGVPILLGAVLAGPGSHARNAGIVWDPVTGPGAMYIKQHPVPFAEYLPMRALARRVSAEADRITSDFVAGDRPGVLRVGPATVGDVICFEVAYDNIVRAAVNGGGQLIVVQTNNATFDTAEARQQLAMVRLRAVEFGRGAVMASTVGVSAFVGADGRILAASGFNTQATMVRRVRLGGERTLASVLGPVPEWVLVALALAVLCHAGLLRRADRLRGAPVARRARPAGGEETGLTAGDGASAVPGRVPAGQTGGGGDDDLGGDT